MNCPEHNVQAKKNQWGKWSHTTGTGPDGKLTWCNKTDDQMGGQVSSQPEVKNNDSFYTCNALNNTVALVCAGKVDINQLTATYKKLLNTLREEPEF